MKRVVLCSTLEVQHISRMECMESCGPPTSTTGMPSRAARMGPMVVPQGLSLRTITSCRGRSAAQRTEELKELWSSVRFHLSILKSTQQRCEVCSDGDTQKDECQQFSHEPTVYLQRHRHPAADLPDNRGGDSRGGVALVAVEFDHRTLKEKKKIQI